MVDIQTKRVYEPYEEDDGYRVLVDRLWPRGLTKERVHYDEWDRSLAPSTATRKAFGHKAQNWDGFAAAYTAELDANPKAAAFADRLAQGGHPKVTLLYAAHDQERNQAVILKRWLDARIERAQKAA
jgi:uncharacterized protein YeaO (DUF488 family)